MGFRLTISRQQNRNQGFIEAGVLPPLRPVHGPFGRLHSFGLVAGQIVEPEYARDIIQAFSLECLTISEISVPGRLPRS